MKLLQYFLITAVCFGFFSYAHAVRVGFTPASVTVSEGAGVQTIQVRLDAPIIISDPEYPQPHLVIGLVSDNPSRVTVSTSAVNYNAHEWSQVRTFTITPVDNGLNDGDATVHVNAVVISGSEYYDGFTTNLPVNVVDNDDTTPPVLTEIKSIKKRTTIDDAVYEYSVEEDNSYDCELGLTNSTDEVAEVYADDHELTFDGLVVGGTYSASIVCEDEYDNVSNILNTGKFTVINNPTRRIVGFIYDTPPVTSNVIPIVIQHSVLRFGQTSPEVKILQQLLNKQGIVVSSSGDGSVGFETEYFGLKTLQAVKTFQKLHGLAVDGVVGEKTWELLK